MFKGSVSFEARIKGNGLTFPKTEFVPQEAGVDKVEIEGPNGKEIRTTVHFSSVASVDAGRSLATQVNKTALDRLTFNHGTPIGDSQMTERFSPITPQPGVAVAHVHAESVALGVGNASLDAATLKKELEEPTPPGEQYYGLFRSARQSGSPVEEYMHMYNILLMLFNDLQEDVDDFIVGQGSTVPQPSKPARRRKARRRKQYTPRPTETDYTRLRNEFAHKRGGVDIQKTKAEMADRLGGVISLTKAAIEGTRGKKGHP